MTTLPGVYCDPHFASEKELNTVLIGVAFSGSHQAYKSKNKTRGSGSTTVPSPDNQCSHHASWPEGGRVVEGKALFWGLPGTA